MRNLNLQHRVEFIMASSDTANTPGSRNPTDWLSYKGAKKASRWDCPRALLVKELWEREDYWEFRDARACMLPLQSCPTLWDPMDFNPPGSSVHGILQARIRGGLPCPPPGDLPDPESNLCLLQLLLYSWILYCRAAREVFAKSLQLCPTLCDPRDGSPSGSPVPGIFQARTLE